MLLKKGGVVKEATDQVRIKALKAKGYEEYKAKASFDIEVATAAELLEYAASLGEEYAEVASMPKTKGVAKIREALKAKMEELQAE